MRIEQFEGTAMCRGRPDIAEIQATAELSVARGLPKQHSIGRASFPCLKVVRLKASHTVSGYTVNRGYQLGVCREKFRGCKVVQAFVSTHFEITWWMYLA